MRVEGWRLVEVPVLLAWVLGSTHPPVGTSVSLVADTGHPHPAEGESGEEVEVEDDPRPLSWSATGHWRKAETGVVAEGVFTTGDSHTTLPWTGSRCEVALPALTSLAHVGPRGPRGLGVALPRTWGRSRARLGKGAGVVVRRRLQGPTVLLPPSPDRAPKGRFGCSPPAPRAPVDPPPPAPRAPRRGANPGSCLVRGPPEGFTGRLPALTESP